MPLQLSPITLIKWFTVVYLQVSGSDSVEFSVLVSQKQYCLNLSPLLNDIESASFKKKSDKFVISLKKASVNSWDKLKK